MNKMEKYLIMPLKLKFYCRYVDDTCNRRNKNKSDEPFERMNKYHSNINLTIEVNPPKFLDTRIHRNKNKIKCFAYHKIIFTGHNQTQKYVEIISVPHGRRRRMLHFSSEAHDFLYL